MPDYFIILFIYLFILRVGVDKVAMEQEDSILVLRLSPVTNMPQLFYNHPHYNTNLRGSTGERRLGIFK
jgi:hypothetical protein